MASRALQVVITGDTRQFSRSMDRAGKDMGVLEGRVKKHAHAAGRALAGLGVAAGAAAAVGLKKSAGAAIEAEKAQASMVAQLRASGISYRDHAKQIDSVIQKHSQLSGLDDEDLQRSFTNIVRVTGDVDKSLRLTGLAADFARAKHMDVAKAGELVGKVAGGNTGILGRYGIVIDKNATAQEALAALQRKFSGQAEAYGKTTAGSMDRASVASENLGEIVGAKLTPFLAKAATGLVNLVDRAGKLGGPIREATGAVRRGYDSVVGAVRRFASRNREELQTAAQAMRNLGRAAKFVFEEIILPVVRASIRSVGRVLDGLKDTLSGLVRFVTNVLTGRWSKAWDALKDTVKGAIKTAIAVVRGAVVTFGTLAIKVGGVVAKGVIKGLGSIGHSIYARIKDGINWAADQATNLINKVNPFGDIGDGIGKKIGDGIGAGGVLPSGGAFGGSLMGARPAMKPFAAIGSRFGLGVTSGKFGRENQLTSSGNVSWHSSGEAIDMSGSAGGMMGYFKALRSKFGGRLSELIYTPGGVGIKDGRPYRYTGRVAADHFDHVHVAFDSGRRGIGDGIGQAASAARAAGFRGQDLITAIAIAGAESRYNPRAQNLQYPDHSIGLWQINQLAHRGRFGSDGALMNPLANAKAAYALFRGRHGFGDWSTYTNGAYRGFMDRARAAVSGVRGRVGGGGGGGGLGGGASAPAKLGPPRGRVGPNVTAGLGGGIVGGPGYEESLTSVGLDRATATANNNLGALISALQAERGLKRARLKKVRRALKRRRMRPATRARLQEEAAQLVTDLAELRGLIREYKADARGGATTVTGAEALEAGVDPNAPEPPTAGDFANLAIAEAGLTPGLQDDIAATETLLGIRAGELASARATGDPRKVLEALEAWRSVKESLDGLKEAVTAQTETQNRLIDLMASVDAEMKAINAQATTLNAVGYREALAFIADSISGQVVGRNLQGRRLTAGTGRTVAIP